MHHYCFCFFCLLRQREPSMFEGGIFYLGRVALTFMLSNCCLYQKTQREEFQPPRSV